MKKYIISVLCILSLLSSMFVLPCSAAGMTVELEHNGKGRVNTVFDMDNDVQLKVIVNSVSKCKPEISCTVKNSGGSTIFGESRIHPMSADETALEVFNVSNREIISGKGENRFYPNDNITREEFVKMLLIAAKRQIGEYTPVFDDVKETDWFMPYVIGAYNESMCNGIGGGLFGSGMNITRQDMSCMVYNLLKNKDIKIVNNKNEFSDNDDIADYAKDAVSAMQMAGILSGKGNNMFEPTANATRAEAAVVIDAVLVYFE